jgi:hypothetical protein
LIRSLDYEASAASCSRRGAPGVESVHRLRRPGLVIKQK